MVTAPAALVKHGPGAVMRQGYLTLRGLCEVVSVCESWGPSRSGTAREPNYGGVGQPTAGSSSIVMTSFPVTRPVSAWACAAGSSDSE